MIRILDCTAPAEIQRLLAREQAEGANVDDAVSEIIQNVRVQGDTALRDYTKRFDGADLYELEVPEQEMQDALAQADEHFLQLLHAAAKNIWGYHEKQKQHGFVHSEQAGVVLGQKVTPLDRVGIYVPGGTARYPSTVLMDAIPAKIAGVGEVIMVTPPGADGKVPVDILLAAHVAQVDRIFKLGGAQAVAALAYGTQSVPRVDKIVGPGNIYVATAKRMVYGQVDIDMIAGPSEILVIADESANPVHTAVDLLSQAEHDKLAASFLVTTSRTFAKQVALEIEKQLETLPRREIAAYSIANNGAIVLTDTLERAVEISNQIAPEHLEVCTENPFALLPLIRHAGSIFLGHNAPEALGDYFAGPNHTLPTSGTARFSSPLSVEDFVKKSSFIYYDNAALNRVGQKVIDFALREGLHAHARSIEIRMENKNEPK
jgi:histidinol dehydrogenase